MTFIDRIQTSMMLRRADNVIRNAKREKCMREHLNRPHVQSDHLISWPVQREKPQPAPEYGIGPVYAVTVISMVALVAYVNLFYAEPAALTACLQIASK